MTSWSVILEGESRFLNEVERKIQEIGRDIDSLGGQDQALELVYSAMKAALDAADADFSSFEQEIHALEQYGKQGHIQAPFLPPPIQAQFHQAPPQYRPCLSQLVLCFRTCLRRPSDTFRQELRKQIGVIVGGLQQAIMSSPPQNLQSVERDVENICTLLCCLEQPFEPRSDVDSGGWNWSNLVSWQGLITVIGSMVAGHFAVQPALNWADNKLGLGWFSDDEPLDEVDDMMPGELGEGSDFGAEEFQE